MLGAVPKLEQELSEAFSNYLEEAVHGMSPAFSKIDKHRIFEGHRNIMLRDSGEEDETEIRKISGEITLKTETILYGTLDQIISSFIPAAESMASSQMKMLVSTLQETTEKTGNIVEGKGGVLSFDLLLQAMEKIEISFDRDGKHEMPTMMVHPDMVSRLEALTKDPQREDFEKNLQKIIDRKRIEWRAREANRTLVG